MGYDQDEIEENLSSTDLDSNDEYLARQPLSTTFGTSDAANPMMQRVLYIEAYSRVDFDGDGIAELRKVCCMGGGYKVVRNLPASYIPFADRHRCSSKKDRTKAGYWSCNLPRYAQALGLGANMNTFW